MCEFTERMKKEGKMEVAEAMKTEGISIELIVKTTGLTKEEVEEL